MENSSFFKGKIIDLTHEYSEETIYWPTEQGFELEEEFGGMNEKGYYYSAKKFTAPEHGGTHMDAPIHFSKGGKTVEQISVDKLIGPCVVVDVTKKVQVDSDYQITQNDFGDWEKDNGRIPENCIILLQTGYFKYWPDREKYLGTSKMGPEALPDLRFPGLHPEAAKWITKNRKINAIGIDTQSIDYGKSTHFETHRTLAAAELPFFENITNLDQLPTKGGFAIALPMKIKEGSGAPLRLVVIIPW
ncbi:MAG: cyclase family protein [Nitrosopumilaceae archaeon]|nr:cyclase family protein [Nitrosopumilaceae archaeon]